MVLETQKSRAALGGVSWPHIRREVDCLQIWFVEPYHNRSYSLRVRPLYLGNFRIRPGLWLSYPVLGTFKSNFGPLNEHLSSCRGALIPTHTLDSAVHS